MVQSLTLFGSAQSCRHAASLIENLEQVKSVHFCKETGELKLLLTIRLSESDWIALLAQSGISGFCLS